MNATILFADNERGIRHYCRQELEADGLRVLLASDGVEAVNVLAKEKVDLAILDEYMPHCSGRESAERIKRTHASLPVVLFTADSFLEGYRSALVDATVIKSPDLSPLKAVITRLLAERRHEEQENVASSAKQARSIAVNAAFFQEIKDGNVGLAAMLASLSAWVRLGPSAYHQRERFIQLLADLRVELAMHFSLEECYGYFDDAIALAPELSTQAHALREEHQTLFSAIDRLANYPDAARLSLEGFGSIIARARVLLDQIQEHERRERDLIASAYQIDLGVGD